MNKGLSPLDHWHRKQLCGTYCLARTRAGLAAARARGRTGGRPPVLTEADKVAAVALLRDPEIPIKEVAKRLGISVAALYQHFPGGRGAVIDDVTTTT